MDSHGHGIGTVKWKMKKGKFAIGRNTGPLKEPRSECGEVQVLGGIEVE